MNPVTHNSIITIHSIKEIKQAAQKLLESHSDKKVFAFYGEMGVGKTTLIKTICTNLDVTDNTSSPTFSLVNEYNSLTKEKIYHFDFYRIKNISEVYDLGYEEYFHSGYYCFIEWPEKVELLLPADTIRVKIEKEEDHRRIIKILSN